MTVVLDPQIGVSCQKRREPFDAEHETLDLGKGEQPRRKSPLFQPVMGRITIGQ